MGRHGSFRLLRTAFPNVLVQCSVPVSICILGRGARPSCRTAPLGGRGGMPLYNPDAIGNLDPMTQALAKLILALLTCVLFFGTLMPGSWKAAATPAARLFVNPAAVAHVVLFAAICFVLPLARFGATRPWQVPALALGLAFLTEGLQFFAIDRHPSLAGVAYDLAGGAMGWALARRYQRAPISSCT